MQFIVKGVINDGTLYMRLKEIVAVTNYDDLEMMELHLSSGKSFSVSNDRFPEVLEEINSR